MRVYVERVYVWRARKKKRDACLVVGPAAGNPPFVICLRDPLPVARELLSLSLFLSLVKLNVSPDCDAHPQSTY